MSESSGRFALPLIHPGQAQKELLHNEALALIDAGLHPTVEGAPLAEPPATPAIGECWLIAPGATGAWAARDGSLAAWTSGGWRFVPPQPGMCAWDKAAGFMRRWSGSGWNAGEVAATTIVIAGQQVVGARQPAVPSPSGGTIIDVEARAAIDAITVALKSHGLID
jgi:hypothetical protein